MSYTFKCSICGKTMSSHSLTTSDLDDKTKAVYHESFGFACLSHHGIKEHFEELLEQARESIRSSARMVGNIMDEQYERIMRSKWGEKS